MVLVDDSVFLFGFKVVVVVLRSCISIHCFLPFSPKVCDIDDHSSSSLPNAVRQPVLHLFQMLMVQSPFYSDSFAGIIAAGTTAIYWTSPRITFLLSQRQ